MKTYVGNERMVIQFTKNDGHIGYSLLEAKEAGDRVLGCVTLTCVYPYEDRYLFFAELVIPTSTDTPITEKGLILLPDEGYTVLDYLGAIWTGEQIESTYLQESTWSKDLDVSNAPAISAELYQDLQTL